VNSSGIMGVCWSAECRSADDWVGWLGGRMQEGGGDLRAANQECVSNAELATTCRPDRSNCLFT
jgi:hypothetical protein